ncbi:MAG TPA: uracil-DNA glycosylase family protein [Gemmatimonadaceae bacterium]|nr:uracil-DNA glycosylase family protein [Gemmatimonadaceae bacterium]
MVTSDTFAERAFRFYKSLASPRVPRGVTVMNPYVDKRVQRYVRLFLDGYFSDNRERTLILGINPGRFGAGITGVTFTDPVALADECGIPNDFARKRELSSRFIYSVIKHLGGPDAFFRKFLLSAVCPLGFTRHGKNLNYYDDRKLERAVTPFIAASIDAQIALGCSRERVIVLGRGKNAKFFRRLNDGHRWFESVHPLDHPRFILQYRRRQAESYITDYERVLSDAH